MQTLAALMFSAASDGFPSRTAGVSFLFAAILDLMG